MLECYKGTRFTDRMPPHKITIPCQKPSLRKAPAENPGITVGLFLHVDLALLTLECHDLDSAFSSSDLPFSAGLADILGFMQEKIDTDTIHDYSLFVKPGHMMCLEDVMYKATHNIYKSVRACRADIFQILANCEAYNSPGKGSCWGNSGCFANLILQATSTHFMICTKLDSKLKVNAILYKCCSVMERSYVTVLAAVSIN